jgi:hypothetical protein
MLEYHAAADRARILRRLLNLNDVAFSIEDISLIFKMSECQAQVHCGCVI